MMSNVGKASHAHGWWGQGYVDCFLLLLSLYNTITCAGFWMWVTWDVENSPLQQIGPKVISNSIHLQKIQLKCYPEAIVALLWSWIRIWAFSPKIPRDLCWRVPPAAKKGGGHVVLRSWNLGGERQSLSRRLGYASCDMADYTYTIILLGLGALLVRI